MKLNMLSPMLFAADLPETIAFYTEVLGFELQGTWPENGPPTWCALRNGEIQLMFTHEEPHTHDDGSVHAPHAELSGHLYFYPDDVDALFASVKDKGEVTFGPVDAPHGMREFGLLDPDGYHLMFGQSLQTS